MGLVDRVRRITAGRIEAFLDSLEDPAAMIPLLLRELEDQSEVLARAEAKARSAVKAAQRRLNEETGHVARLGRGAELALRFGEEHTAREALARQVVAERSVRAAEENLAQADKALQDAREVRSGILRQQDDLSNLECPEPYLSMLQQRGVEVLYRPHVRSVAQHLRQCGHYYDLVILSRLDTASRFLGTARRFCPSARLVYDTVDLHYLREQRLAALTGDDAMQKWSQLRERVHSVRRGGQREEKPWNCYKPVSR